MVHLQQREVNIDEANLTLQSLTEAALRLPLEVLDEDFYCTQNLQFQGGSGYWSFYDTGTGSNYFTGK